MISTNVDAPSLKDQAKASPEEHMPRDALDIRGTLPELEMSIEYQMIGRKKIQGITKSYSIKLPSHTTISHRARVVSRGIG